MLAITTRAVILVLAEVPGDGVATPVRADPPGEVMELKLGLKGLLTVVA